jgi:hypothetical protein
MLPLLLTACRAIAWCLLVAASLTAADGTAPDAAAAFDPDSYLAGHDVNPGRLAAYTLLKSPRERAIFAIYASDNCLGDPESFPEGSEVAIADWTTPEDAAIIAAWPAEMVQALANRRHQLASQLPELRGARTAAAAGERCDRTLFAEDRAEGAGLDQWLLPFDQKLGRLFVRAAHRRHGATPPVPDNPTGPDGIEATPNDVSILCDLSRILLQDPMNLPPDLDTALGRALDDIAQLTPATATAAAPVCYYQLGYLCDAGYSGKDGRHDHARATGYYRQAALALGGKYSNASTLLILEQTNNANDDARTFVATYTTLTHFLAHGTSADMYPWQDPGAIIAGDHALACTPASLKANFSVAPGIIRITLKQITDGGTLKRYATSKASLATIMTAMPDDPISATAAALAKRLP